MSKKSKSTGTAIADELPVLAEQDDRQIEQLLNRSQETTPYQQSQMKQDTWDGLGLSPAAFDMLRQYNPQYYDQAHLNALDYTFREQGTSWDPAAAGISSSDDLNDDTYPDNFALFGIQTAPDDYRSPYDPAYGYVGEADVPSWMKPVDAPSPERPERPMSFIEQQFGGPAPVRDHGPGAVFVDPDPPDSRLDSGVPDQYADDPAARAYRVEQFIDKTVRFLGDDGNWYFQTPDGRRILDKSYRPRASGNSKDKDS